MHFSYFLVPDRVVHAVVNSFARVCTIFSVQCFFLTIVGYSYFLQPFCPLFNVSDLVEFHFPVKIKFVSVYECKCLNFYFDPARLYFSFFSLWFNFN